MTENPLTVAEARALFPVTRRYAYFNTAANAPLATPVVAAMEHYIHDLSEHGSVHYREWFAAFAETRELAARLLGARGSEVAFVRNTSEGINIVANGLALGAGDSVVLVHGDFPANVHPWLRLRDSGVDVRVVRPDDWNRVTPEQLLCACDESTRIVSASFVSFSNGFQLPLAQLAEVLHSRGILLFIDAIQGLGCLPLDVAATQVDFLAADAHKWLLAPEGIGLFYVRSDLLDRLRMTYVSWLSMKDPFDNVHYRGDLHDDARRFEFATPNTAGVYALRAALRLLLGIGIDAIAEHVLRLTDQICDGLIERGYALASPRGPGEKSGIVAFQHHRHGLDQLRDQLEARDVVIAKRAGMIRVAAHLFNDASDVARLLDALPA